MSADEGAGAEGSQDESSQDEGSHDEGTPDARPHLRIVRGDPTPEDVAALTVVLAAASGGAEPAQAGPTSRWAERSRLLRRPVHAGPGGWRASALPG